MACEGLMIIDEINQDVLIFNDSNIKVYQNEFTYLAAYSLIKQAQATGEVDKIVLERLNNRCAERMGVRPIPL